MSGEYDSMLRNIGAGLAIGIWMYSGFDELSVLAGEIKDAHEVIPKALMIVIPLIVLTYELPTIGGLASVGRWELWTTEAGGIGYASVLTENLSPVFGVIFMAVAIIGQCSIFNVTIATGSRCILVLADEQFGPQILARLSRRKATPFVALIIVAAVTILLIPFDFTFLVVVDVFFMVTVCTLTVVAALILKRQIPDEEVPFKSPGGRTGHTIMCFLIIVICVFSTLVNGTDFYLGGLLWILIIPILYILSKWKYKGLTNKDPLQYPINPKTGLGFGDLKKIGGTYVGVGIYATLSRFFLRWYEGDQAKGHYLEEYKTGLFSNFELMLKMIVIVGICSIIVGLIFIIAGKKLEKKPEETGAYL